jgi:hypothetical protein
MKSSIASLILCGLMLMITAPAPGQSTTPRFMRGVVTASNKPVPFVWVVARQSGAEKGRSLTGDDGSYYIKDLPNGSYDLVVTKGTRTLYQGHASLPKDKVFNIPLGSA